MATDEDLSTASRHAAQCGLAMQARLHDYEVAECLRLSLRVGIGAGEVMAATVGDVGGRWEFLMPGAPLVQMSLAEPQAGPGQVVVAPEAWVLLREHCVGHALPEGGVRREAVHDELPEAYRHLEGTPGAKLLRLNALSLADTWELLRERLGVARLSETLVTFTHSRAEGNPLFSEGLSRSSVTN